MAFPHRQRPELIWLGKDAQAPPELCLLVEDPQLSISPPPPPAPPGFGENRLIHGDNYPALRSLESEFSGKIKCIYLDPPFNTGQPGAFFDDAQEHARWLSFMRDRLALMHGLLAPGGLLWLHLDNTELHYAKILLDEIFGRSGFIAQVTYERSGPAGLGQGGAFINTAEYLLVYGKGAVDANRLVSARPLQYETMRRYTRILTSPGERTLMRTFKAKSNGLPVSIYEHSGYRIDRISLKDFVRRREEIEALYAAHFDRIFRTTNPQRENVFQNDLIARLTAKRLYSADYTPSHGRNRARLTTLYYFNRELCAWLRDTAQLIDGRVVKTDKLTDVWVHADIPKADLANEGGVEFKRGKKPEQLLRRIIEFSTQPGDWVLDAFAGSGATGAVAHKMGRRWIMIELGEQCLTHIHPRMRRVIDGADQTGVSKALHWRGGGGFRFYKLLPATIHAHATPMNAND